VSGTGGDGGGASRDLHSISFCDFFFEIVIYLGRSYNDISTTRFLLVCTCLAEKLSVRISST
jgi:hypothetical protein